MQVDYTPREQQVAAREAHDTLLAAIECIQNEVERDGTAADALAVLRFMERERAADREAANATQLVSETIIAPTVVAVVRASGTHTGHLAAVAIAKRVEGAGGTTSDIVAALERAEEGANSSFWAATADANRRKAIA